MADFKVFMPITKIDEEKRTISGYASTPKKDSDGEIVTLQAIKDALPDYMQWGNIREMHKLSAVGVAHEANIDKQGLFITAQIVDDVAWEKCKNKVYKGFSIGGRKLDKEGNKITALEMTEISVVDRPANSDCAFALAKSAKAVSQDCPGFLLKLAKPKRSVQEKAIGKLAKVVSDLAKAGPPAAHDGLSLPAKTPENVTAAKAEGEAPEACEKHGKVGCKKCAIVKRMAVACEEHDKVGCAECAYGKKTAKAAGGAEGGAAPYGDVVYADPGLREDGKKRYPIDTEDHIRAAWNYIHKKKNAAKYPADALAKVKAKIVSAWKKKIDKIGPPSLDAKVAKTTTFLDILAGSDDTADLPFLALGKAAKPAAKPKAPALGKLPAGLELAPLRKSMETAGSMSYTFDSLRRAQRSLIIEGKREGGDGKDKALAMRLGDIAKDLAAVISQKALHEGAEATDLSDADDAYIQTLLGDGDMTTANTLALAAGGDPIAQAILDMVKRAAAPTKAQMMSKAAEDVDKSRKAMKMAKKAIEECHKLHKAAFLAKAAKAKGKAKPDDDEDDFDHAGAMEKLQKAYGEIDKARMFGKAAGNQLGKAMGRAGQAGQEVADGDAGVYEVPKGVKNLTPAEMATASPGGDGRGGEPPMYPASGEPYKRAGATGGALAKYVKNGMVPADIAELVMKAAQAEGELEALKRMPAAAAGRGQRPYSFDTSQVFGQGQPANQQSLNKALFDGVNVGAIGSGDERAHTEASARAIGNFLTSGHFGKSVFDPSFKGAAGAS